MFVHTSDLSENYYVVHYCRDGKCYANIIKSKLSPNREYQANATSNKLKGPITIEY